MNPVRILRAVLVLSLVASAALSADRAAAPAQAAAMQALSGLAAYSHKAPYSEAISDLYLGYNATGVVVRAVALRMFKTYETVTAMAVVALQDGAYVVTQAAIPDIAVIKSTDKQRKVLDAIKSIVGRKIRDADGTRHTIDAVTGATRYNSRIYSSYDLMARKAIEELERNPDWPRVPLAK